MICQTLGTSLREEAAPVVVRGARRSSVVAEEERSAKALEGRALQLLVDLCDALDSVAASSAGPLAGPNAGPSGGRHGPLVPGGPNAGPLAAFSRQVRRRATPHVQVWGEGN
jgi:hypothetical protein